jgi:hypothetical protein
MRAPLRRASLSAMATACFRFRTLEPDEERRVLRLYSRITLLTLPRPRPPPLELRPLRLLLLLLARRAITVTLSRALARRRRSCRQNRSALVSPPRAGGRPGMFSGASGGAAAPPSVVARICTTT